MLGMYIHTNWGYHHPYAARSWTIRDWEWYLEGLHGLGYDFVMIWPLLDCMPPQPNASDRAFLTTIARAIDLAHDRFGMKVAIVAAANTIGNASSGSYPFTERPYFLCEAKIDPRDAAAVDAFLQGRSVQLAPLARADILAIIDSDPGGYIGATNEDFILLVERQAAIFRTLNPQGELVVWLWFGWEMINRFHDRVARGMAPADAWEEHPEEITDMLVRLRDRLPEPWWLYQCRDIHEGPVAALGLREKALFYPYNLLEHEPSFPLVNNEADALAAAITPDKLRQCPRGAMGNLQTHCLQLPHTYLFAHLATGGTRETVDLAGFADRVLPGLGETIAGGWQALADRDAAAQRTAASRISAGIGISHRTGQLSGLLFGDADRFLTDLVMNLQVRAALLECTAALDSRGNQAGTVRRVLDVLGPYQRRIGFVDAYGGALNDEFNGQLARLQDSRIDAILAQFNDWQHPEVRNGLLTRLLAAAETYCAEHGA